MDVYDDVAQLCRAAARELLEVLTDALGERGTASIVLTGGGTGTGILTAVAGLLPPPTAPGLDWSRVHLWWGDERFVPVGDAERNELQADRALLQELQDAHALPARNIHRMPAAPCAATSTETGPSTALLRAAEDYASALAEHARHDPGPDPRTPVLDVVLLGVGPDAHVASLFPGRSGPSTTGASVLAVTDSPKPPPERLTLSLQALNSARQVWFVVAGPEKAPAVSRVLTERRADRTDASRAPASAVAGTRVSRWFLDRGSAGQ